MLKQEGLHACCCLNTCRGIGIHFLVPSKYYFIMYPCDVTHWLHIWNCLFAYLNEGKRLFFYGWKHCCIDKQKWSRNKLLCLSLLNICLDIFRKWTSLATSYWANFDPFKLYQCLKYMFGSIFGLDKS